MKSLKLSKIKVDTTFFIREGYNRDAIERYKDQYSAEQNDLPPLLLQKDTNILIDGFHRLKALKELDQEFAQVEFLATDQPFVEAVQRNIEHGVPLSKYERNEIIKKLYLDQNLTKEQVGEIVGLTKMRISQILKPVLASKEILLTTKSQDQDDSDTSTVLDKRHTLNEAEKTEIIKIYLENDITQESLANKYNTSQSRISQIVREFNDELVRKYVTGYPLDLILEQTKPPLKESQLIEILIGNNGVHDELLGTPRIIHGDLFQKIDLIPDESVDLIYADPPFNITKEKWDTFDTEQEFFDFTEQWLRAVIPKLKETGRLYISFGQQGMWMLYNFLESIASEYDLVYSNLIVWNHRNNMEQINHSTYKLTWDPVFYYRKSKSGKIVLPQGTNWTEKEIGDVDYIRAAQPQTNFKKDKKLHPTQKPMELLRFIIETGSNSGDVILDPMAGAGTTAVACIKTKRNYIVIEKEKEYVDIIKERVRNIF